MYVMRAVHFKMNLTFKVILIGVSRNPPRIVVIMYNVDIISETYEDIAAEKIQIHRFEPPTPVWGQQSEKCFRISRNDFYCHKPESCRMFSVYSLLFTHYFWNSKRSRSAARKRIFFLSSFKFVQWAPKDASVQRLAVQGHPRSMILVPIESAYATSY